MGICHQALCDVMHELRVSSSFTPLDHCDVKCETEACPQRVARFNVFTIIRYSICVVNGNNFFVHCTAFGRDVGIVMKSNDVGFKFLTDTY